MGRLSALTANLFLFCCSAVGALPLAAQPIAARQVKFRSFDAEAFRASLPIVDLTIDDRNGLWLATGSVVWRVNLLTQKLTRFDLPSREGERINAIRHHRGNVYVASEATLLQINTETSATRRYTAVEAKPSRSSRLAVSGESLVWLRDHDVGVKAAGEKPVVFTQPPFTTADPNIVYFFRSDGKDWWLASDKLLLQIDLDGKTLRGYPTSAPISHIDFSRGNIVAFTPEQLIVIDPATNTTKQIAIEKDSELLCYHLTDDRHTYAFKSGLIDIFKVAEQTRLQYQIEGGLQTVDRCAGRRQIFAILSGGNAAVFQLFDSSDK